MTPLLFYMLSVTACSGLLLLYYAMALRNNVFHRWNRFYLLSAVVLSLALPLLKFTVADELANNIDGWDMILKMGALQQSIREDISNQNTSLFAQPILTGIYCFLCLLLAGWFLFACRHILRLIRSHNVQKTGSANLIVTSEPGAPFSFFNYIFWNPAISLQSEEGRQIFQHEMVHVEDKHSFDKIFLQLVLVFFWFNPFFWLIRKELHCVHEFIADEKSVKNKDTSVFAALVLQSAMPVYYNALMNPFFKTAIKRRMMMLTKKQNPYLNYAARLLVLPLVALTAMAFTVQTEKTAPEGKPELMPASIALTDTLPRKAEDIKRVDVDKKNNKVQITYMNGTTRTLTKKEMKEQKMLPKKITVRKLNGQQAKDESSQPLFYVDGTEYKGDANKIDPSTIESINVLKGEKATGKYGEKARSGVVEITMKKAGKEQ